MMNLTIAAAFSKKLGLILAAVLLIGFLLFLIISRFSPHPPPKEAPKPIEKIAFETFPGRASKFIPDRLSNPANIPQTLPIYKLSLGESFLSNANSLASKLGFKNPPEELNDVTFGQGLLFSKEDGALSIYKDIISHQKFVTASPKGQFDQTRLKLKASQFVSDMGLPITNTDLESEPTATYQKFSGESLAPTKNPAQANFITFNFNYALEGLKVVGNISDLRITLNPTGEVTKLIFKLFKAVIEPDSYPALGFDGALKLLLNNQGFLIDVAGEREDIETAKNLGEVFLNNVYLAYYLPTKQPDIIQPVWIFEGESKIDNLPVNVTFAVPAIESKYLSPSQP